jgi:hypothetical protein
VEFRHGKRHRLRTHAFAGQPGDWCLITPRSMVECGEDGTYLVSQEAFVAILTL